MGQLLSKLDKIENTTDISFYQIPKLPENILKYDTGWNDKIVVLKKTTLQLYFKTFTQKINSGKLIM